MRIAYRPFVRHLLSETSRRYICTCSMMSSNGQTHVERTQDSPRSDVFSDVTVREIHQLSPTVKAFSLQVADRKLTYAAGQWVDLHIPGEDVIGGYSIASPPHQLKETGTIDLAIKHNVHPPTLWMTTKCKVGDRLSIRVGGDFTYTTPTSCPPADLPDLLLIAGGVGINPLFSMLQHHLKVLSSSPSVTSNSKVSERRELGSSRRRGLVRLLYSSKSIKELLFKDSFCPPKDQIDRICREDTRIKVQYFATEDTNSHTFTGNVNIRRINTEDISSALQDMSKSRVRCFICGPPPMTENLLHILTSHCTVSADHIHYEKWW